MKRLYTLVYCHRTWAYRLTVSILEEGEFIPLDFDMPRKIRTMSMTPFVIACECQARYRQRLFASDEACACWLLSMSRSLQKHDFTIDTQVTTTASPQES
jgi:hypothetical protein